MRATRLQILGMSINANHTKDMEKKILQVMFTKFCKNDKNESTHKSRRVKKMKEKKTARITTEETNEKKNYKSTSTQRLRDHLEFLISISPNFFFKLFKSINLIFLFV